MKKIIYIINSLRQAGPVIVLRNIVSNLDRSKFDIQIVKLMDDELQRSITHEFKEMGIQVHELGLSKIQLELNTNRVAGRIDRMLSDLQPDLIHTHGYHPVLIASRLKYKCPKIETLHNISGEDYIYNKGKIIGGYMNLRYLNALKKMSGAVAISDSVRQFYINNSSQRRIDTVYNGVSLVEINSSKIETRKKLGLNKDAYIFICVGSLSEGKDPLTVIKAFLRMKETASVKNAQLLFLGKGGLIEECKRVADGDKDIIFIGWKPNPMEYLLASDMSVCASHSEGFGLNFVESLICGTPVISTDIPVFNEFIRLYPSLKRYQFHVGDFAGLAQLMSECVHESIDISRIRDDAKERFSASGMAMGYMDIYKEYIK